MEARLNSIPNMSRRQLSTEELGMAARMKAAIAADPTLTEDRIGEAIGVSQGQVSHWTNGRLPVPAKRATKLAELLGISDPGDISLAFREVASSRNPAAESHSHHTRLDPQIVSATHESMAEMYSARGRTYHQEDVARFVLVYEKLAARKAGVPEAELFGAGLSEAIPIGGYAVERDPKVPSQGTHAGAMARRVRRKA